MTCLCISRVWFELVLVWRFWLVLHSCLCSSSSSSLWAPGCGMLSACVWPSTALVTWARLVYFHAAQEHKQFKHVYIHIGDLDRWPTTVSAAPLFAFCRPFCFLAVFSLMLFEMHISQSKVIASCFISSTRLINEKISITLPFAQTASRVELT